MFHPQWSYRPEEWCIILDRSTGEATANNHIKQEIGEAGTSERCFTVQCFHTTAVKLHSYVFQGSTEKNITISENIFDRTFFKLVKSSIHWPDRVLFPCFESSSFTLYFHYDQSTFVACLCSYAVAWTMQKLLRQSPRALLLRLLFYYRKWECLLQLLSCF